MVEVPAFHRVRYASEEAIVEDDASRLRAICALADAARELMRARLKLEHPEATQAAVDEMLRDWLRTRPGAEHGDGVGRPGRWPRR